MRGRAVPKLFFFICFAAFLIIFFHTMLNVGEAEVPGWEFNISRNLNNYIRREAVTATIMPKDFCDSPSFLVIMCISSPSGFEARRVIRKTWGRERSMMGHNVSLYFLIGQTTDLDLQKKLNNESLQFKDIVQEDFYDSYNNLTLKSAMMLKLFTIKCQSRVSYLMKIDDDVYLNLPKLVDDLMVRNQTENLLMGSVICGSRPIRASNDKWYAGPNYLFPYNIYPSYMSGTSYCMSADVAEKLLDTAMSTPVFHLEDVYLTGICAKKMGLNLTHNGLFTFHYLKPNFCLYKPLITIHYQEPGSIQKIHDAAHDPQVEKQCQKESEVMLVHKWLMHNVLMDPQNKKHFLVSKMYAQLYPQRRQSSPQEVFEKLKNRIERTRNVMYDKQERNELLEMMKISFKSIIILLKVRKKYYRQLPKEWAFPYGQLFFKNFNK